MGVTKRFGARALVSLAGAGLLVRQIFACSTLLAGRGATSDGSVLMSHSCDGDVMGLVYVMPAQTFPPGTRLPMYWNVPRPRNHEEYQANLRKGFDHVGTLPIRETSRSLILAGNVESTRAVGTAYAELVDFLMLRYLVGNPEFARASPPRIAVPTIPDEATVLPQP